MYGDDPKRVCAHAHHVRGCVEQLQQDAGNALKGDRSACHDTDSKEQGKLQSFIDAGLAAGTVVVGKNRDEAVVQTEDRHEEEALELEIHTEDSCCRGGEADQNQIHEVGHDGADGHHEDGRHADIVDPSDDGGHGMEHPAEREMNLFIEPEVQEQAEAGRNALTENGGIGCSGNAELRKAAQAEDHNRIEDNVDDGPGQLGDHRQDSQTGGLQKPLEGHLEEQTDGERAHNAEVCVSGRDNLRDGGLALNERTGHKKSDAQEGNEIQDGQKQTVAGGRIGVLEVLLAKGLGEKRIDADAGSGAERDHKVLQREREGDRGERVLTDLRDEDGVHDVVECLHQHGDHHRNGHVHNELSDRHHAHLVFFYGFFCLYHFS